MVARARFAGQVLCARVRSLTSVHGPRVGSGAGDVMCDGGKRRDKPAWKKEMQVLYIEVLATHDGPEPWKAPDNRHGEVVNTNAGGRT